MSATFEVRPPSIGSRRARVLAGASAIIATASVAVTLAVSGSDGVDLPGGAPEPATAIPDRAKLHRSAAALQQPRASDTDGLTPAQRFHYFR